MTVISLAWIFWRTPAAVDGPIVLVSIDTLRADRLPIYGYRQGQTPAIDAFARDGIVFDHAWAHSPQTLPSHVSILTGRLPFEHGVRDNVGFTVRDGEQTLPAMLRERGFESGGFVSSYVLRDETGVGRGFDVYDAALPPSSPETPIGELQRDGSATLAAAEAWLDRRSSRRFFLFFHIYEPHTPYAPPPRFRRPDPYDGEISYADEIVGSLFASLKRRGLYDEATIVLLSDHGEGLGDHGEQEHGLFIYSETLRVPFVIKLPGQRRGGTRLSAPVQHSDLVPTLLDLAGASRVAGLHGRSLVALLDGGAIPEAAIYSEALYSRYHYGWSELYGLTDARYRFIRAPRNELYDIRQDPGERRNLAVERQQTGSAMRGALEGLLAGASIQQPGRVSEEARERLRALGYIGTQPATPPGPGFESLPDPKDKVHVLGQYRAALALVRESRFAEAVPAFRTIADANPAMGDVWSEIGGLLVRLGRYDEAIAAYKRVVEVAPYDPSPLISVASSLMKLGKLDEAAAQAEGATHAIPENEPRWRARAHQLLAMIALERKDAERARAEAKLAGDLDATLPVRVYVEALIRYNAGDYAGAVPLFEQVLRLAASRTIQMQDVRYFLGDALGRLERYPEAERALKSEVVLFPYHLRARAGLAMLYRATGRNEEAGRAIEDLLRVSPTPEAYALAEKLWRMFGERAKASEVRARANRHE